MSAPDRIWATVNGMSTRLPDGRRQLVGGWSEDKDRVSAVEYVRADLVAQPPAPATKYLNLADGKVYKIVSEDQDTVTFILDHGGKPHHLGRAEFEKRFQLQDVTPVSSLSGISVEFCQKVIFEMGRIIGDLQAELDKDKTP